METAEETAEDMTKRIPTSCEVDNDYVYVARTSIKKSAKRLSEKQCRGLFAKKKLLKGVKIVLPAAALLKKTDVDEKQMIVLTQKDQLMDARDDVHWYQVDAKSHGAFVNSDDRERYPFPKFTDADLHQLQHNCLLVWNEAAKQYYHILERNVLADEEIISDYGVDPVPIDDDTNNDKGYTPSSSVASSA
jgi:hypothetical protein